MRMNSEQLINIVAEFINCTRDSKMENEFVGFLAMKSTTEVLKDREKHKSIIETELNDVITYTLSGSFVAAIDYLLEEGSAFGPIEIIDTFEHDIELRTWSLSPHVFIDEAVFTPNGILLAEYINNHGVTNDYIYLVKFSYAAENSRIFNFKTVELQDALKDYMGIGKLGYNLDYSGKY